MPSLLLDDVIHRLPSETYRRSAMPGQKAVATQQRRNMVLDAVKRLSRSGHWVTQPELVKDMTGQGYSVEKHHVLRDLRALLEIHPQLECNDNSLDGQPRRGLTYGYRWIGKDAPPETGLSIPEALSLVLVSKHLKQALPSTLTRALDSLFDRAEKTLDIQKANAEARWKDVVHVVPPTQPLVPPTIANDVLNVVHDALLAEEQIDVAYRNASNRKEKLLLHPLGILMREPVSYLVALCNDYNDPRLYAIHRFQSAKRTYVSRRKPDGYSMKEYSKEQGHFGLVRQITLKALVCQYLATVLSETPLDATQVIGRPDKDGWFPLTVKVRNTWQLRWWILSHGSGMVVDEPKTIREAVADNAREMVILYSQT